MGYYVETATVNFTIKPENFDRFFELVKSMFEEEEIKAHARGGSWSGGTQTGWHYSWIDADLMLKAIKERDICQVFLEWGFEDPTLDEDGSFGSFWYNSKTGQEDLFLDKIAEVVESGSYIDWRGEDGEIWRNEFIVDADGLVTMRTVSGTTFFPQSQVNKYGG